MRELKYHEKKLIKKVDFLDWKNEDNLREIKIMRRYYVQNRDDLKVYNYIFY
jgi:U3 small nucleolar ribonucleoprotein protein IMP3